MSTHEAVHSSAPASTRPVGRGGALVRIAVIGGGITGLAAAHRLVELGGAPGASSITVELFDASPRLGGCFGTERIGEYVIETGADSFVTDKPAGIELVHRLGLESRLIGIDAGFRRALILKRGKTWPVPDGLALLAPSSVKGLAASPLLSLLGKLRAAAEFFVPPHRNSEDESIAAFAVRRFGREMYERVLQPLVGGIYTGDPANLSLAATFPRFIEMEQRHGSLIRAARQQRKRTTASADSGVRYGLFASFREGMSELPDALQQRIELAGVQLHRGERVTAVRLDSAPGSLSAGFGIETSSSSRTVFDAVILALPGFRAADLIADWASDLAGALREIEYASSAIVVTGHRLTDVAHPLDAAGLVVPHAEQRKILAVSFLSRKFPSRAPADRVILRTFVGGALQPELLDRDDDALVRLVRDELSDVLGVSREPEFSRVVRYDRAMPQYVLGHVQRVERIEQLTSQIAGLELAGNAFRGVGIPDCIQSGENAAERVWAHVAGIAPKSAE
jgi:protoporphyrinogen/coproporphyrinogen III oxidase